MQDRLTPQERGTIYEWLRHNRALRRPKLVLAAIPVGRADRYYSQGSNLVAVEVTQVLIPEKQRLESDARLFLSGDIAPLVAGRLPRRFFGFMHLPWQIPRRGTVRRRRLAEAVADRIVTQSLTAVAGESTDASVYPQVKLRIHPTQKHQRRSELVFGGSSSLYGGWEGPVSLEQMDAIRRALADKAARGQLAGADHRVLLLQDRMLGIAPTALDEALAITPSHILASFDEVALVSTYNDGSCHCVRL